MIDHISENTKAILLLCAPLLIGKNTPTVDILKPAEYKHLAKWLHSQAHQPADFLGDQANDLLSAYHSVIPSERLSALLGRGFQLSQALDMWASRSIWVMSRADEHYPRRLKNKLREDAPAILYACGNAHLAHQGGLAVVGSRHINEELIRYTTDIGKSAVDRGQQIISGGAKGVDLSAMLGALTAGGAVIGVLADSLFKTSVMREFRDGLMQNRLLLLSHIDPSASFNVGMAMQRNKYIYALADQALVVNADLKKGGTWAGAEEQLTKYQFVPIYVRNTGTTSPALIALQQMGAKPWDNDANQDTPTISSDTMDLFSGSDRLEPVYAVSSQSVLPFP
jgi:DNA processing protein